MAARHRTHASVMLRAKLDEVPLLGGIARGGDAHTHDVIARRPVTRDTEGLIRIREYILDGQEAARLRRWVRQVSALLRHGMHPVPPTLLVRMHRIGEAKVRW